jgi:hypothetical protein
MEDRLEDGGALDMSFEGISIIAVIAAAVAAFGVGAVWYAALFPKQWLAATGKTEAEIRADASLVPYAVSILSNLIMAIMLAALMRNLGLVTIGGGLLTGFLVWLGFVMTTMSVNNAFGRQNPVLLLIDGGHWLAVLLVIGLVLGAFG